MEHSDTEPKRVTVRLQFPVNIFFESALITLRDEAKSRDCRSHFNYTKALKSLAKYPLELNSSWEALNVIEGFGKDTCRRLESCLRNYRSLHGNLTLEAARKLGKDGNIGAYFSNIPPSNVPKPNSSSRNTCAEDSNSGIPVKRAKTFPCSVRVNRTTPDATDADTGSSVSGYHTETAQSNINGFRRESSRRIEFKPGEFDIVLIVDWAESGISELKKAGLDFERRRLSVGDFVWIARSSRYREQELILDYIVERKRLDDLAKSICEARYRDQKVRLRECGINNRIFLVEWTEQSVQLNMKTLNQAMLNTQVHEDFYMKVTKNASETALYLSSMTKELRNRLRRKHLKSTTSETTVTVAEESEVVYLQCFCDFQTVSLKTVPLTVREVFARQLMVCRGMTGEKVNAIVSYYPTFISMLQAYQKCVDMAERNILLADIVYGNDNKRIGPALSRSIAQFFEYFF